MAEDYYAVLAVATDASAEDIKRAFREIARRCHPDVAGGDPGAEERFKTARKAYETLIDPVARARYDRRGQRRAPPPGGSFFDAFYRSQQGEPQRTTVTGRIKTPRPESGARDRGNDVTLDDLFDSAFVGRGSAAGAPKAAPRPPPRLGEEVHLDLEIGAELARDGGSTTAIYHRLQRSDSWRPGAEDAGLLRVQEQAEVRIVPGTRDGEILRQRGMGDAGSHGGPYGDLVIRVRIAPPKASDPPRAPDPGAVVELTVVEALLGGRLPLDTPQGRIWLTIPPGTSSGVQLRLRGKGEGGGDLLVTTRIVVPKTLDPESRRLIEEFARLNPKAS